MLQGWAQLWTEQLNSFRGPVCLGRLSRQLSLESEVVSAGEASSTRPLTRRGSLGALCPASTSLCPPSVTAVALWTGFLDLSYQRLFLELDPAALNGH